MTRPGSQGTIGRLPLIGRVPLAAWLCAAVALLNGLAWSLITPPFQVPDEIAHFAYVQHLAETGDAPRHVPGDFASREQLEALAALRFQSVAGHGENRPVWTPAAREAVDAALAGDHERAGGGASSVAVNNPPLFYALQAIPYRAASSATLLDRLAAMRLLSVLLGALTVLAVFLFLREVLPSTPWAWTVGALAAAFQPLFGFVSTAVSNDSGLFLASALLFLALARAFRRGLTPRRGLAIGVVVGLGAVTKLTFVALLPAVALAVAVLAWRARADRGATSVAVTVCVVAAVVPFAIYLGLNQGWDRELFGGLASPGPSALEPPARSLGEELSYTWQLYLPRLPFQEQLIAGFPPRTLWLNGMVGRLGWQDYSLEPWAYDLALVLAVLVLALAVAGAWRARRRLRDRAAELAVYAVAIVGLMLAIARFGYDAYVTNTYPFEQARYLLPLLPLYAAVVALAARGAGPSWGRPVGAAIVLVAAGHGLLAQLHTLARYYG